MAVAEAPSDIVVEVALAAGGEQRLVALKVAPGTSALEGYRQALSQLALPETEQAQWQQAPLGCFGQRLRDPAAYQLAQGDRIEAYAPLKIDPKAARRARAGQRSEGSR